MHTTCNMCCRRATPSHVARMQGLNASPVCIAPHLRRHVVLPPGMVHINTLRWRAQAEALQACRAEPLLSGQQGCQGGGGGVGLASLVQRKLSLGEREMENGGEHNGTSSSSSSMCRPDWVQPGHQQQSGELWSDTRQVAAVTSASGSDSSKQAQQPQTEAQRKMQQPITGCLVSGHTKRTSASGSGSSRPSRATRRGSQPVPRSR